MNLAVIFNGQGAHYEGMGIDFVDEFAKAKQVFTDAEAVTQLPIQTWINSDINQLALTKHAQPSIVATSLAIFESIKTKLPAISYMAGLSLGEYSSLIASGMLGFEEGLELIKKRGDLMSAYCQQIEEEASYQMAAVINMPIDEIKTLVQSIHTEDAPIYIANYNSPTQIVVAGSKDAIGAFRKEAKSLGYRKVIPLKVEGPFHTPIMSGMKNEFEEVLVNTKFQEGHIPVISNVTVDNHSTDSIRTLLNDHLVNPVKWYQTIHRLKEEGITHIVQIGPGNTLAKLMANDDKAPEVIVIDKLEDIEGLNNWLNSGGK
ncbi:ACP S-malonyltransferase [Aerococcaceae bacterium DSM 111021]|nr:ACP S-malonyltransferase [Aerococcaceae bacterium DSM 111021]